MSIDFELPLQTTSVTAAKKEYMKKNKSIATRVIAITLTVLFIIPILPSFLRTAFGASLPVNVYIDSYESGTVSFHWDQLPGTKSVVITYHTVAGLVAVNTGLTGNSHTISGLQKDFIYDISIRIYNAENGGGAEIGKGFIYFSPGISFFSAKVPMPEQQIAGGGYESGAKPVLKFEWSIPKVWDGDSFEKVDASLEHMQNQINNVYNDNRQLSTVGYRINISTSQTRLNGDSAQSSIEVEKIEGAYKAKVSSINGVTCVTEEPDLENKLRFYLQGRKDDTETISDQDANDSILPDPEIFPGTVYYMNIKPVFRNNAGANVSAVSVGIPENQNGSGLSGVVPYAYTPIRYQLSKDNSNNIYVRIFKINKGSLDLPRLFYQVQTSDDPSVQGDWKIKKTLDDTYFSGDFAVTVVSGINPNNKVYFKIVAKSDSSPDRIESNYMPYVITQDETRPPVPTGLGVSLLKPVPGSVFNSYIGKYSAIKSTDVTIYWDKPDNFDSIKGNIYYHFLLNTVQSESQNEISIVSEGNDFGKYVSNYRLIKYVSASSPNITEKNGKLYYTLKGFDLYTWEDVQGNRYTDSPHNSDNYPAALLPNKTYYFKMYTTKAVDKGSTNPEKTSDISTVKTFTTISQSDGQVPLPKNVTLKQNGYNRNLGAPYFEIQFEKVNVDWLNYLENINVSKNIYYDIYLSLSPDNAFPVLIGTTGNPAGDLLFTGVDDIQSTIVKAYIYKFSENSPAYGIIGSKLRTNTPYFITVKTRLKAEGLTPDKSSRFTSILPVTTTRGDDAAYDDSSQRLLTPYDFQLAADKAGNLSVTGTRATFRWTRQEEGVKYAIICTKAPVLKDAQPASYINDAFYKSFISYYGNRDSNSDNNTFILDPANDIKGGFFEYNAATKEFKLTSDGWLYPNTLYYFSIRAVSGNKSSIWISIPVTTSTIEAPLSFEVVRSTGLGVMFRDASQAAVPEDYSVSIKQEGKTGYKVLTRSAYNISKDGTTVYLRINNLDKSTTYSVKVTKGTNQAVIYEKSGLVTLDARHNIEIRWKGLQTLKYSADVKSKQSDYYKQLSEQNFLTYTHTNGTSQPYFFIKTSELDGTPYVWYYARIISEPYEAESKLQNVTAIQKPLLSNSSYSIKIRSYMVNPVSPSSVVFSKYTGPVETRTEFNQLDQDLKDVYNAVKVKFVDKISIIEQNLFYNGRDKNMFLFLVKGNMAENSVGYTPGKYTVDISEVSETKGVDTQYIDTRVVYIPEKVIETLDKYKKSLLVKCREILVELRPESFSPALSDQAVEAKSNPQVKELYYKISIQRIEAETDKTIEGFSPVSSVSGVNIQVVGMSKTDNEIRSIIHSKIYSAEDGLLTKSLAALSISKSNTEKADEFDLEQKASKIYSLFLEQLSVEVSDIIKACSVKESVQMIKKFNRYAVMTLHYKGDSQKPRLKAVRQNPTKKTWEDAARNGVITYSDSMAGFETNLAGNYMLLEKTGTAVNDIGISENYDHKVSKNISNNTDIDRTIYKGMDEVTIKLDEMISYTSLLSVKPSSLYEKENLRAIDALKLFLAVMGIFTQDDEEKNKATDETYKTLIYKNKLEGIMPDEAGALLDRKQLACILTELYAVINGLSSSLVISPGKTIIKDVGKLSAICRKAIEFVVSSKFMDTEDGKFSPEKNVSIIEALSSIGKLVQWLGTP